MSEQFATFFGICAVLARLTGFFLVIPGWSHRSISPRIKVLLIIMIGLLAVEFKEVQNTPKFEYLVFSSTILYLVKELLVGIMLAIPSRLMFAAVDVYGEVVSSSIGLSNSFTMGRDEDRQETVISNFLGTCLTTLVFVTDTHLFFIAQFIKSFQVPAETYLIDPRSLLMRNVEYTIQMFWFGVKLGAPFLIIGLVTNIGAGIINRMIQQIPVYFVTMPILLMLGILFLLLSAPVALMVLIQDIQNPRLF